MKNVIAKNRIDGVPGFATIASGTVFECPDEVYEQLKDANAVDDYAPAEVAVAAAAKPAAKAKTKAEDGL